MDTIFHLYFHIPFCVDRCGYCDFYRRPHEAALSDEFVDALVVEIGLRLAAGTRVETIFVGGGTPSLLTGRQWEKIARALFGAAQLEPGGEFTIEANPNSVTAKNVAVWRKIGVNRVSLGVQTLDGAILKQMSRVHSAEQSLRALEILAEACIERVSADLIYGIPGLSDERLARDLDAILPRVGHLSAYALTVEPGTPFEARGVTLPEGDAVAAQYDLIVDACGRHGLARYEISNFARHGEACRHNQNTWRYGAYVAFGPSGVGFDGSVRYRNVPDVRRYMDEVRAGRLPVSEAETPGPEQKLIERLMLGLRTPEGVVLDGADAARVRDAIGSAGLDEQFIWSGERLSVTPSRVFVLDRLLTEIYTGLESTPPQPADRDVLSPKRRDQEIPGWDFRPVVKGSAMEG